MAGGFKGARVSVGTNDSFMKATVSLISYIMDQIMNCKIVMSLSPGQASAPMTKAARAVRMCLACPDMVCRISTL